MTDPKNETKLVYSDRIPDPDDGDKTTGSYVPTCAWCLQYFRPRYFGEQCCSKACERDFERARISIGYR